MIFSLKKLRSARTWLITIFVLGLIWIFGSFFMDLSFPDSSYNFLGATNKVKLDSGKPVTQHFVAKENNLNQIKVILQNAEIQQGEKINFELMDADCENTLAISTHRSYHSSPFIYYRFRFAEITTSAGQTYCLRITYYSPLDRGSERPYLGASEGEPFTGWSYFNEATNRVYENRTLQMRPSYGSGSFLGDLQQLNNRLSQYKPEFLKGASLTLLFLAFLIGTISLVWLFIFKKED